MVELMKKYRNLNNEQYGELIKLILQYNENQTINGDTSEKMIMFFLSEVKPQLDKILKHREATKKYKKNKELKALHEEYKKWKERRKNND